MNSSCFNNIQHLPFREESSLVDIFVLETLVNYLESLSLAHSDDQAKGTASNITFLLERKFGFKNVILNYH